MAKQEDTTVFREFKLRYSSDGGQSPTEAEEAFMERIAPRVARMARQQLTSDVRKAFDTSDITSTVMRRVVGCVRSGTLSLDSEGQFMSMLSVMTRHAIIDKHDYLSSLIRDQSRNVSMSSGGGGTEGADTTGWDLTESDDARRTQSAAPPSTPIDNVLLAEKTRALNELCGAIRKYIGNRDDWELFRMRFLEETPWAVIAEELEIHDDNGQPSPDAARMRMMRQLDKLRPKLREYEQWLSQRP